ncbi:iron dicitrate transport regulator FecR [Haematobacter missouriensis]|uniref:Iron dicitrate transport regulator FecR n=2 Tax=Haematobacter missouriensis TaxID=366616 RepID=A0A212AQ31_9RHOB|nr:FecR domain-containing protein [Haematobacter missouriensis]KFI30216.1 iron dicitrate transport regulator FecR [Haematobacter missouriensis]OWJ83620.1 iron dicitrate transport regulator FecR [Haematobacter missouriensis]
MPASTSGEVEEQALDWFLRLGDDRAAADRTAFEHWLAADARHRAAYDDIVATWQAPALRAASAALRPPVHRPDRSRQPWAIAARIAAVLLVACLIWQAPRLLIAWQADYTTRAGEQERIALADGTQVTLNTGSAIAVEMTGGVRHVRLLAGEAFFDVAHDALHPFIVTGRQGEVRVTGTEFAVRLDEVGDRVMLREGHVAVREIGGPDEAMLEPGEAITALASGGLSPVTRADTDSALAWLGGRMEMRDAPLATAVAEIGRYRAAPVMLLRGAGRNVSGSFSLRDPDAALAALAGLSDLTIRRLPGGAVVLY